MNIDTNTHTKNINLSDKLTRTLGNPNTLIYSEKVTPQEQARLLRLINWRPERCEICDLKICVYCGCVSGNTGNKRNTHCDHCVSDRRKDRCKVV